MQRVETPLPNALAWAELFSSQIDALPILRQTHRELEQLKTHPEINLMELARIVLADPFLTLRTLVRVQRLRSSSGRELTTVPRALMMIGFEAFYREIAALEQIESLLADQPQALRWLLTRIARARKASSFAHDWATLRRDLEHQEVTVAALLYEINEMLLWLFAPKLMLLLVSLRRRFPHLALETIQHKVFNTTDVELRNVLIEHLNLPSILKELMDPEHQGLPRTQLVMLSVRFARHLSHGWRHPKIAEDIEAIEQLVHLTRESLLRRLGAPEELWKELGLEPPAANEGS